MEKIIDAGLREHLKMIFCSEVNQICQPLFKYFSINLFIYAKVFDDGRYWTLSSHGGWVEHFYLGNYVNPDIFSRNIPAGYYLDLSTLSIPDLQIINAREYFNLDNWFNIIKKEKRYYEVFAFATPRTKTGTANIYMNNLDILEHFILYFKNKGADIIAQAEQHCISQKKNITGITIGDISDDYSDNLHQLRQQFFSETAIDHYFLTLNSKNEYLTKREFECLSQITQGMSVKETARFLGLSDKTVISYMNNAKNRLSCSNIHQLIKKYRDSKLSKIILT